MPIQSLPRRWLLPEEPAAVRLLNTIWADSRGVHDHLESAADVDAWLDAVGIDRMGAGATPEDLALARSLRDAARRLAAYVTADSRDPAAAAESVSAAVVTVNAAAGARPVPQLALRDGSLQAVARSPASPIAAGIAQVADAAIRMLGGPQVGRLRACHAPGCVLYFVTTHPRREWCSVTCGNRARAARHYAKVRSAG